VEEVILLSSIVVVLKKNDKLWICVDVHKLNVATKKYQYPLPFIEEIFNMVAGHEMCFFLDGFSNYHQIMLPPEDWYKTTFITDWGAFGLGHHAIQFEECPPHPPHQRTICIAFKNTWTFSCSYSWTTSVIEIPI